MPAAAVTMTFWQCESKDASVRGSSSEYAAGAGMAAITTANASAILPRTQRRMPSKSNASASDAAREAARSCYAFLLPRVQLRTARRFCDIAAADARVRGGCYIADEAFC